MTMYRYIALMWPRTDRETALAAKFLAAKLHEVSPHAWSLAWDGAALAIYHSGEHNGRMQTYRLQGERGAVLGSLFRTDYTSVVDDLDEFESRKCLETKGQHLIDNYWGRYVAFLNDPETGTRYVMRDPSGAFPCFHTLFKGVTIYFSDMQDAANFDFLPFTVNWNYLSANIMLPQFQKTITGLNEVSEVLPAECVEVTPFEEKKRFVWNPTELSQTNVVEDPEEAAELLRGTVKGTIGALAGCYDRVVHNLGGFDSSVALACMAQAPKRPEITCITNYTNSPGGEERRYSRQVAEKYGVELVENKLDYRKVNLTYLFETIQLASPLGFFDCIGFTGDVLALAKERRAQALFYGVGGDQVYSQTPRNFGALDYVRCHSLFHRQTLKFAMEASRYGRKSLAKTLSGMIREQFSPSNCYKYVRRERLQKLSMPPVNMKYVGAEGHEKFLHPLLIPDNRALKGKYLHILFCALFSIEYLDHLNTNYYAPSVHVYLSQPIVETCLRIPIWIMTHGGVDRGLARKAFRHDLPLDVGRRVTKSTPQEYYDKIFSHNIEFLRENLLDGIMVREGLLLREKVEHALSGEGRFFRVISHRVLCHLATEIWLRRWINRPVKEQKNLEIAV